MAYRIIRQTMPLIAGLRKRHFAFLFIVNQVSCVSADMSTQPGDAKVHTNGLLLYQNLYSFYSQKVVMALHEKNLHFDSHLIDIAKGEQYKPWFLHINPLGEVPVLQDTGKIIPDSGRIIDYLEDNFSNGDTPRLIPMNKGSEVRQKVSSFKVLLDSLPANVITMGTLFHPELVQNPRIPFIGPVRTALANAEKNSSSNLRKYAQENPDAKDMLLKKADAQDEKHKIIVDKNEFLKLLAQVDEVLTKVEEELATHTGDKSNWWLCSDSFTVADISLTILLERLSQIGLENRFWADGKRPNVANYYERVKERDSYKKTIPGTFVFVKLIFSSPILIGVSVATLIAVIIGGVFIVKKFIS
ncbi:ganglioside-induced differentiation-associated protein 1 [Aethina tumida]|uniref:ganglioside-induced differentiation-associated protein 1 n=1 Tax=Aethina tumida TaxID=116153 RepID=UPI00096B2665|nr:ganglioside-induced differentiation-associated protein 1 [Aethina tumida]